MINSYTIVSAIHLASIFGFTQTQNEYFLIPAAGLIAYAMFSFIHAVSMILSPGEVEIQFDDDPSELKLVQQSTALLSLYILYMQGYELFAGAGLLLSITTILSIIKTWLYFYADEEEDEE